FEILHDEKRRALLLAHVVERAYVRVGQMGDRARFTVESVADLRIDGESLGEDLDCDDAVKACVAGFVHFPHAAGAERREDFVRAESSSRGKGHVQLWWWEWHSLEPAGLRFGRYQGLAGCPTLPQRVPTDQCAPERNARLVDVGPPIVPNAQAAELIQPCERPFDDPPPPSQAAAVCRA